MSATADGGAGLGGLFQIAEPDEPQVRARAPGRGIGIDLGTTHSLVAIAPEGAPPRVLADEGGEVLLPSVVAYLEGQPAVGRAARARQVEAPERVISSVKRFMGRGPQEIGFDHPYRLGEREGDAGKVLRFDVGDGRLVTPMEVSAEILRRLAARAEAELGGPVDGAVITVPAYFDDTQRQATKDAGRLAGLKVYRLLAEPTAAALAYGLDRQEQGLFAVYDLGGGTFDISILRLKDGVFQVLATAGDTALGGDDLDRALAGAVLEAAGCAAPTTSQREAALAAARRAKEALSSEEAVQVDVPELGLGGHVVTREVFEELARPIVQRTASPCRRALEDAGVRPKELGGVVLVGGSTRVPLVRRTVERLFRQDPLADIDPDVVVAHGAAIQADILSGTEREGVTLLDVVPLSLGVETMGGIVEKIIPRNATIPIRARQVFTNYSEQQTGMTIHVVQGERELVDECRSLARFELAGIPQLPPSHARIEVMFQLDADALLTVTARELMTGVTQTVQVKPTFGLSEDEVEAMILDSLEHAQEDFVARDRAEARVELGRVLLAVQRALSDVGDDPALLPEEERARVEAALAAARKAMDDAATDGARLVALREALEAASEPFARRRMERALREGMGGKALGEVEAALEDEASLDARRGGEGPELLEEGGERGPA